MSREIKFRAWVIDDKKMVYDVQNTYDFGVDGVDIMENHFGNLLSNGDYAVMQYTGLKDKNGVGVYEGDIYRFPPAVGQTEDIIEVAEDLQTFFENKGYRESELDWDYSELEVIGNIYENPELLRGAA